MKSNSFNEYLYRFFQFLDLQRIEGRSGGFGPGVSQQEGNEVPVVDHVRRILRSQLDTLLLIDQHQQTGMQFPQSDNSHPSQLNTSQITHFDKFNC